MANHSDNHGSHNQHTHHHILPVKMIVGVGAALLTLTVITVAVAHVDLGRLNFVVAMAVASLKASMVALFFMNLWYDKKENGVMFATSFLFLAIFIVLTSTDMYFRGDVYVKGPLVAEAKSKIKNPWISTPELVERGKTAFATQCVSCHGAGGQGNGPAAGALNPPPRNFTATAGWKNGRSVSGIYRTLKEGVPGSAMASFATLPADDRWALTHYVISLNPTAPDQDTPESFKKAGVDTAGGGGEAEEKTIPVALAIERMATPDRESGAQLYRGATGPGANDSANVGAQIYSQSCVQCHGANGEGGIKVRTLGVWPKAFMTTRPFSAGSAMGSGDAFNRIVIRGLPGEIMPGNGQLSGGELRDLFGYVKGLQGSR